MSNPVTLSKKQREELLRALKARFEKNMNRHKGIEWAKVQAKLEAKTKTLWSLNEMERTGRMSRSQLKVGNGGWVDVTTPLPVE